MTEERKSPAGGKKQPRPAQDEAATPPVPDQPPGERGGPEGPEPTRYGDWEVGGRCSDF